MEENPSGEGPDYPGKLMLQVDLRLQEGIEALLRAFVYAQDASVDVWNFAMPIEELVRSNVTHSDLRWLLAKEFVLHGTEISAAGDKERRFQKGEVFNFASNSCIVLTGDGARFAENFLNTRGRDKKPDAPAEEGNFGGSGFIWNRDDSTSSEGRPKWDPGRRELWFVDKLVKRFRVPARNQQWILEVFEEDGWPKHIDDPLPPSPDIDSKTRLQDAIHRLNGKQINSLVRFRGNGSGTGIYWEPVMKGIGQGI